MGAPLLFAVSLSPRLCHLLSDSTADRHSKMNSYSADWATKLYDLAHVHGPYLAASTIIWTAIYLASAPISRRVSATYRGLPFKLKMQWDNRIVAFLHAVVICYAAFWGLLCDEPLKADHLHAYSSWAYATMITACGYFIWDAVMCIQTECSSKTTSSSPKVRNLSMSQH